MTTVIPVGPDRFAEGIEVAVSAKRATGFPSDMDEETLRTALSLRQHLSEGVWLAVDGGETIGHALCTVANDDHPTWGRVTHPAIAGARASGRLLELGGLSVRPEHHRHRAARLLQAARLEFARSNGYVPVAAAWNDSPGSTHLCSTVGTVVAAHHDLPITLFLLSRAA